MLDEPYQDLTHLTPNHCSSSTTPLPAEHWLHRPTWHKQKPQLTNTSRSLAQLAYRWSHVGPLQEVCSTLLGGRQPPARSSAASLATTTDLGQLCALVNRLHLPPLTCTSRGGTSCHCFSQPFFLQQAAASKAFAGPACLRVAGWWGPCGPWPFPWTVDCSDCYRRQMRNLCGSTVVVDALVGGGFPASLLLLCVWALGSFPLSCPLVAARLGVPRGRA